MHFREKINVNKEESNQGHFCHLKILLGAPSNTPQPQQLETQIETQIKLRQNQRQQLETQIETQIKIHTKIHHCYREEHLKASGEPPPLSLALLLLCEPKPPTLWSRLHSMEVKGFNFVKDALEEQEKVNVSTCVNPNDNPDDKKNKKRRDSGDSSSKTHPKRKKLSTL